MTPSKQVTVLLAEDHLIVLEGLKAFLELEDDIEVVAEAENGRRAVELTRKLHPAVVVMDIAMPLLNGLEAARQILRIMPATRVLFLSAHGDDAYVKRAMALGAAGYLVKLVDSHALSYAIREVHKGNTILGATVSRRFHHHERKAHDRGELPPKKDASHLTSRETEVLQLIAEGKASKQAAEELHISVKTVEKHRQSLMGKLNIHDIASLTRHAISEGIIESRVQVSVV